MSSKNNKHCILETRDGKYMVSSYRDEEHGRHFIVDDFYTSSLGIARNTALCRAEEFGGTWHDAPGYDDDPEQRDSPIPSDSQESNMKEATCNCVRSETHQLNELKVQVSKIEGQIEMLKQSEEARSVAFMNRMEILNEFVAGRPTKMFMKSVIEQLTDDCYTAALADKAIRVQVLKELQAGVLPEIEAHLLSSIKEAISVDVSCYLE